jgi:hypothetical protein
MVLPLRIHALDQPHLPGAVPILQSLLPPDSGWHGLVYLVVDEAAHTIALGEPFDQILLVQNRAANKSLVTPT